MSKARPPKRMEEYTAPSEIEEIREDILEKGTLLKTVSEKKFPDAEEVRNAMAQLLGVVKEYKLVGKWVISATTKEIRDITLAAVIECTQKSYTCFETNPDVWREINGYGLTLLAEKDLDRYQKKFPNEEDTQEDWSAVIRLPGKHVNLLVGQQTNKDLLEETDEENYHDEEEWDQVHKNYFLAYHQVTAHAHWCASSPVEAAHYERFQLWYSQQAAEGNAPGPPLRFV